MIASVAAGIVMLKVIGCISPDHDVRLGVVACLICLLGAHTAARLLCSPERDDSRARDPKTMAAIASFGLGIWAAHAVTMLAFRPDVGVTFDLPLVVLSLALAIGATTASFLQLRRATRSVGMIAASGLLLGAAINGMHFVGVQAMSPAAARHADPTLMLISCLTGGLLAIAGLWAVTRRLTMLAAVGLTFAVLSAHFIGMASVTPQAAAETHTAWLPLTKPMLLAGIAIGCLVMLALAVTAERNEQHRGKRLQQQVHRLRVLADSTFEGLIFERGGYIVDINRAMGVLAGHAAETLTGRALNALIPGFSLDANAPSQPTEHALVHRDGRPRPVEIVWREGPDPGGHVVAVRLLPGGKAAMAPLKRAADHDPLTGLANRAMFEQFLDKALAASRQAGAPMALLYADLDRFETVCETFGQQAGEQTLVQAAQRLRGIVQPTGYLARLGRDEFAIIQPLSGHSSEAASLAERVVTDMAQPFEINGFTIAVTASVGVTFFPDDDTATQPLIKCAVLALRRAKREGRGIWRYYEPGMELAMRARRSLEHDLSIALSENQFTVEYQPFYHAATSEIAGFEALVRWHHPQRGSISPAEFIPVAEASGLIIPIGNWVLQTACTEAASWNGPMTIAVNLSPIQFGQLNLLDTVSRVLEQTGLPPNRLELEITEGVLIRDGEAAVRILAALKGLGLKVAMDDFGTGYSSLSYLRKFPFDKIKIDRSFVTELESDPEAETIVQAIIAMGRSLRLAVTAEGVETQAQFAMLRAHGCTFIQGFLLGRPLPANHIQLHIQRANDRTAPKTALQIQAVSTV